MHTEKMMNYVKTAGADALLLLDEADMHYVCGFSPSEPGSTRRTPACR